MVHVIACLVAGSGQPNDKVPLQASLDPPKASFPDWWINRKSCTPVVNQRNPVPSAMYHDGITTASPMGRSRARAPAWNGLNASNTSAHGSVPSPKESRLDYSKWDRIMVPPSRSMLPSDVEALRNLTAELWAEGDYPTLEALLQATLEEDETDVWARLQYADLLHRRLDRPAEAERQLARALTLDPDNPSALALYAAVLSSLGKQVCSRAGLYPFTRPSPLVTCSYSLGPLLQSSVPPLGSLRHTSWHYVLCVYSKGRVQAGVGQGGPPARTAPLPRLPRCPVRLRRRPCSGGQVTFKSYPST